MSGFAARTGFPDREPVLPPLALADMIAGLQGSMAVMMALRSRDRGKSRGQVIDLSLLEPIFGVLGPEAAIYRETGDVKERCGSASNTSSPRNVYQCSDGKYVALSGSMQPMAMRLFDAIGRADMKDDPDFTSTPIASSIATKSMKRSAPGSRPRRATKRSPLCVRTR